MSNTLKFGNGEWATKEGSTLAYNDENGNFKPLPFNFTRATSATRVNKEGLIEVVGNNEPRIDFKDNSKGALLLEPERSNLYVRSNQFETTWAKLNLSVFSNNNISPDGSLNGYLLKENEINGSHDIRQNATVVSGLQYTYSIFVKKSDLGQDRNLSFYIGGTNGSISFNTTDGTFFNIGSVDSYSSESYGNGWWRLQFTDTSVSTSFNVIAILNNGSTIYTGDGVSGIYIYGAQLEQGSYATSYIPTSGQSGGVTRVADSSSQTPPSGIIGQTEGTIFVDFIRGVQINNTQGLFGISSASGDNRVIIWNIFTLNSLGIQIKANGANIITSQSLGVFNNGENYKIAVSYKSGEIKGYVNGLQVFNLTNTFTFTSALSEIYLNNYANNSFTEISPINELQIYNTALTDLKLQQLTTL